MTATQPPAHSRRRRWLLAAGIISAVLLAYVLTLGWATRRLETDIQKSIRPLPMSQQSAQPAPAAE